MADWWNTFETRWLASLPHHASDMTVEEARQAVLAKQAGELPAVTADRLIRARGPVTMPVYAKPTPRRRYR